MYDKVLRFFNRKSKVAVGRDAEIYDSWLKYSADKGYLRDNFMNGVMSEPEYRRTKDAFFDGAIAYKNR